MYKTSIMIDVTEKDKEITNCVCDRVCKCFQVSKEDTLSKSTIRIYSLARGYIWYILHYDYEFSPRKIAKIIERSNVRNIKKLISKTKFIVENQRKYKDIYEQIKAAK